ncbi:MAG TPA: ABC transporter permease [Acidiferrobacterales bacterium]|nr:ABC transporter permease [Acidiferrobacterales bacterium]
MLERVPAIAIKETRELLRDPIYLGLAFVIPMIMILLFGFGLILDIKHLPVAFVDHDGSPWSRDYRDRFVHSEYFDLVGVLDSRTEIEEWMRTGRARVIIDLPPEFGRDLARGRPVAVGVTVDGSFPNRAAIITGYVSAINALYNQQLLTDLAARRGLAASSLLPVQANLSVWYNPTLESKNAVVPGLLVLILMLFPALLGALLIVREKETGTIFNLYASPTGRLEIILGKLLPYLAVAMLDYLMIFAVSRWIFEVRFTGSFLVLTAGAVLYSVCTIGIGLLISVLMRSQLAAMFTTLMVTMTTAFNYSGFITPVASMDAVGQFIAQLIPATHFMTVVRGSYLKGFGFGYYWPQLGALALYTLVLYSLAWLFLKKRIG